MAFFTLAEATLDFSYYTIFYLWVISTKVYYKKIFTCGSDCAIFQVASLHYASVHLDRAFRRQYGAASGVERVLVLHDGIGHYDGFSRCGQIASLKGEMLIN
jgi:hypothetical protein